VTKKNDEHCLSERAVTGGKVSRGRSGRKGVSVRLFWILYEKINNKKIGGGGMSTGKKH